MALDDLLRRLARAGQTNRRRPRRSNRPRGEGMGFIDSILRLFGRR